MEPVPDLSNVNRDKSQNEEDTDIKITSLATYFDVYEDRKEQYIIKFLGCSVLREISERE